MKAINVIILLLFIHIHIICSNSFILKKYSVDNGLSENTVRTIMQDKKGFMWFGTKDGLNRFDGSQYKIYKRNPDDKNSLGNNFISTLYQDENEKIWVGTDGKIYIFDYYTEKFTLFNKTTADGVYINNFVTSICPDTKGNIWIGTEHQGLFKYDLHEDVFVQYTTSTEVNLPSNTVWKIFKDDSNTIWIGTREGLCKYDAGNQTFSVQPTSPANEKEREVMSIFQDSDGILWCGTWADGLIYINKTTKEFKTFFDKNSTTYITHIRKIFEYKKGELMIGADDGLYLFNKTTLECVRLDNVNDPNSLSDQNVYDICKDKEGGIWIGTYFGGVNYVSPNNDAIQHYYPTYDNHSFSGKAVSQFYEDKKGNLWIATEDGGISYFNPREQRFLPLPDIIVKNLSYHNIHSLLIDDDKLWVGTFSRGIDVFDLKTHTYENFQTIEGDPYSINDNCIFALYKSKSGDIYIGTPYGLCVYKKEIKRFERIPEIKTFVYDILEDNKDRLWIASYTSGAFSYNYKTKIWKNYQHYSENPHSIGYNKTTKIYLDEQERLWFATEGGGISRYNYERDNFSTINSKDGLPNDVIYGILDDKYGNLWASTNKGIVCVNPITLESKIYTKSDGLQSDQFNYRSAYKSPEGWMYFGGLNGFNILNTDKLIGNEYVPPVFITQTEVLTQSGNEFVSEPIEIDTITGNKSITLKYNTSLNIHFISLSYLAQDKNMYAYQMEGIDSKWVNIGTKKSVSFATLPGGKYTFRVKGSNNDGVWNEAGDEITIIVLPPFWKTGFAYALYAILLIAGLVWLFHYLVKNTQKKHKEKLEEFRQEKEREAFEAKINFFTNIAHEIRTPLSLIKAPLESIIQSGDGLAETKQNISVIEKNTDRLLELVNQLLDFRKIETDYFPMMFNRIDVKTTIEEIIFRFRKTANQKNISINLEINTDQTIITNDKEAFTKIISNLLTNALKYTDSEINICVDLEEQNIVIRVADNGIGIPDASKHKIFEPFYQVEDKELIAKKGGSGLGLALVKELVNRMHGDISLGKSEKGALFILKLPIQQNENVLIKENNEIVLKDFQVNTPPTFICQERKNILVVEDSEDLRNFFKNNLTEYDVFLAQDGKEALSILEQQNINVIISDVMMPEMDGFEFTRAVKNNELYSHIPIILLTARTQTTSKIEGLELGADFYIEKPFSVNYLKAQIASILENRRRIIERFTKRPLAPFEMEVNNKKEEDFVKKLNKVIEDNIAEIDFSIEKLAYELSISRSNLQRKIKGVTGMVPNDYIRLIRLKKAAQLLTEGKYQVNEVCYLVGFNSASYFAKCFQKQFGILPKEFMMKNQKTK